ncbi:MAG TPA: hypothetical protein VMR86_10610 [Myxococcota bacterium]|nr:hypothetical protein [Myxococcota bacterium]
MSAGLVRTFLFLAVAAALVASARSRNGCSTWTGSDLPHGLCLISVSSSPWVADAEGWGVITPGMGVTLPDGSKHEVHRIESFSLDRGLLVEVSLVDHDPYQPKTPLILPQHAFIALDPANRSAGSLLAVALDDSERAHRSWTTPAQRARVFSLRLCGVLTAGALALYSARRARAAARVTGPGSSPS